MTTVAYVDETHRVGPPGFYALAASTFRSTALDEARVVMTELANQFGVRRVHWHDHDVKRRLLLVEAVAGLPSRDLVVISSPVGRKQERARRRCLETLLWELGGRGVTEAVLESRGAALDRHDRRAVDGFRSRRLLTPALQVTHTRPQEDPALWIADALCGAVAEAEKGDPAYLRELGDVEILRVGTD
jgi:hypothetical protein